MRQNIYKLYCVRLVKGILMSDFIQQTFADNIIEAEATFEKDGYIAKDQEYIITITLP